VSERGEPEIVATARGGIEMVWALPEGAELDVTLPPDASRPFEVYWTCRTATGSVSEQERELDSLDELTAAVLDLCR
jgi:hypothetical protein